MSLQSMSPIVPPAAVHENTAADILVVRNLKKHYPVRGGWFRDSSPPVHAVDGVDFALRAGETLGLVGESGCGKSTVGKVILRLTPPTEGEISLDGVRIDKLDEKAMRAHRRRLQVVFQDPYASLNPRMRAKDLVAEPLRNFRDTGAAESLSTKAIDDRVAALFDQVGLRSDQMPRYAHEFSGGQRQRLAIARALALEPAVIICDEAVSALDVSVQAQVINLLSDIQQRMGVAFLFISHDLAVIEHMSHRVAVMYLGRIVEITDKATLFANAKHPYTQALLQAAPMPQPGVRAHRTMTLDGEVPSPIHRPSGCHFHTRCPFAMPRCKLESPALRELGTGKSSHRVSCHLMDAEGSR